MTRWHWPTITRDSILFGVGLAGIVNEAFVRTGDPRPELLVLFAGMVGLPVALRKDERREQGSKADVDDGTTVGA